MVEKKIEIVRVYSQITGWWYTYPSEKMMEFVSWDYEIPN